MHHPPKLTYSGLTILMSNPSRLDDNRTTMGAKQLLSGNGGLFFTNECLYPNGVNRFQCDIMTVDYLKKSTQYFRPNTRCVLALGEAALSFLSPDAANLNAQRGSPLIHKETGIPIIASYFPQDCVDKKDLEGEFNESVRGQHTQFDNGMEEDSAVSDKKRHGKTNRKNWRFWLRKDVEKAVNVISGNYDDNRESNKDNVSYIIYPSSDMAINALLAFKDKDLYFDCETDTDRNITCFSFAYNLDAVYVIPIITHTYGHAYPLLPKLFSALASAIKYNTLVAHNGSGFDFLILSYKYKIPITHNVYDSMLAQNRIFPEVEKSLGHSLSLPWLYEPYHKDEGSFAYGNQEQAIKLWRYCGKDVSSLIKLKAAQTTYALKHPGLTSSIKEVNSYIRSYVTITLTGIRYSEEKRKAIIEENDRLMMQYLRMLDILIGKAALSKIRANGKSVMASSPKQCARYFHDMLKYPMQGKTATGQAAVNKKALFKLKLKFTNPVIDVVIAYRRVQKESGLLKFIPLIP